MAGMAGIIISPSTEHKIRSRNSALRLKHGSPKFKDILRQRCRQRMKESRGRFVDQLRKLESVESIQQVLTDVVREDMSQVLGMQDRESDDFHATFQMLDLEMHQETLTEEEEWVMSQYNQVLIDDDYLQQLFDEANQVICPLCIKGNLQHITFSSVITCTTCPMAIPARASLPQVHKQIHCSLDTHSESGCSECPQFFISQEENSTYLYVMCEQCSFLSLIV